MPDSSKGKAETLLLSVSILANQSSDYWILAALVIFLETLPSPFTSESEMSRFRAQERQKLRRRHFSARTTRKKRNASTFFTSF